MIDELKNKLKVNNRLAPPYRMLLLLFSTVLIDAFDLFERFLNAIHSLFIAWPNKALFGVTISYLIDVSDSQSATIFSSYFLLIVIDIFTRLLAQTNKFLLDQGIPQDNITTILKLEKMGKAFDERYIATAQMWGGFVSKFFVFIILLPAAFTIQSGLESQGLNLFLKVPTFIILFLFYNEFLSIAENMRDSGVAHMDTLCTWLTTDLFGMLKAFFNRRG